MLGLESNSLGRCGSLSILKIEWGRIEVERLGSFRDVKLFPSPVPCPRRSADVGMRRTTGPEREGSCAQEKTRGA